MIEHELRLIEALIFASAEPLDEAALAARLPEGADVTALLERLRQLYAGRGVTLVRRERGWAFRTAPDLAAQLRVETEVGRKLSRAALETLAIIAYHQPVTRAEIEEVRGVALSKGTLDVLFEAGWIRPRGRRRTPGRPVTWATTDAFLDHFGLESLDDLPGLEELKASGLLDTRPAMAAYSNRAQEEGPPVDMDEEAMPEPLDPLAEEAPMLPLKHKIPAED
ncbi:SMC-Scp complex subunit ScpB [Telmatospirillum sp. J64-1]|uniref:SMC-Scp complex subunit ScpB n=1 Tax=Telmatospirillum sp. J64-1 TaxID=2502183 RepID=UPI00115F17FD|nr:SMC-Scp complex subunit ScpB [Telmatospirillum sp. J64-1]